MFVEAYMPGFTWGVAPKTSLPVLRSWAAALQAVVQAGFQDVVTVIEGDAMILGATTS